MHYQIHNGARDVHTRTARATRAHHKGLKQHIMNASRRLIRGRPVTVTGEELLQHIEELRAGQDEGTLYVTTLDGRDVDLWSLAEAPAVPAPNPRPEMPLDTAATDKAQGLPMNEFAREAPPPAEFEMPVPPPAAAVDQPVDGAPETQPETEAPPADTVVDAPATEQSGKKKKNR